MHHLTTVILGKLSFTAEELKDLFTLHTNTDCNTHDLIGCGCECDGSLADQDDIAEVDQNDVVLQAAKQTTTKVCHFSTGWCNREGDQKSGCVFLSAN